MYPLSTHKTMAHDEGPQVALAADQLGFPKEEGVEKCRAKAIFYRVLESR